MIVDRLRILGQVFGSAIARKQADEALRASEERLRELTETTHVIPWEADARTWRFTYVGPQAERMLGYPIDRWYEDDFWAAHIHPDDRDFAVRLCAQSAERLDHYEFEYRMLAADGAPVWLHDLVSVVRENGQPVLLRGFMVDITARKQTEQALRHLSARLICAQEDERGRIARELHDDLNQRLALLSIGLEQLRQKPPASSARAREQLEELLSRAREISSDVQRISHRLHPSKLEHLGLVAALRGLCTELSEPRRVEIGFRHNQVPRPLPGDVALCLYRVAQEALHNVVKHSRARSAQVELIAGPRSLRLTVTDSGVGFVPDSASGNDGLGLVSMRERLRLLGGELAIHSRPGNGTRVEARLPLPGS
jgi:PAS domain S-box-containing protein